MKKVGKNQWKEVAKFVIVEESCSVEENSTVGLFQHMCDCMRQFRTTQGLGAHKLSCNVAIAKREKDDNERMEEIKATHDRTVFSICNDKTAGGGGSITRARVTRKNNDRVNIRSSSSRERSSVAIGAAVGSAQGSDSDSNDSNDHHVDGRSNNRGSAIRKSHTSREKVNFVEMVSEGMEENNCPSVRSYFADVMELRIHEVEKFGNQYSKWKQPKHYENCLRDLLGLPNNGKGSSRTKCKVTLSPFHRIETELYRQFVEHRKNGKKVSASWIRINAMKIFNAEKLAHPDRWESIEFKASFGWMRRFIRRKKIKFRKRKCGKEKTAEESIPEFEGFMEKLRFDFLQPREDDGNDGRDPLWGRFPPARRYNMDQVPLPFVVSQDDTFTMEEDTDVNIKCPKESLRKRQFTMHQVYNAGIGEESHGWCDSMVVCRGTGKIISQAEKNLYDNDIDVLLLAKEGMGG